MKLITTALVALAAFAVVANAHDINGGGWEHNESLSGETLSQSEIDPYAENDAVLYVKKHHDIEPGEYQLQQIAMTNAIRDHKMSDPDQIKMYCDRFVWHVEVYFEAK